MLWGEVTSVLTSATIPPRIVERVGLRVVPDRGAQRRQPVRLPVPRAALRRPAPAGPACRRSRGGAARGARAAAGGRGRAHPGALHQQAGDGGGGGGPGARAPLHAAAAGRSAEEPPAREVRHRRDLVPVRHHGLLAGRGHPGPCAVAGDDRQAALPPAGRPAAPGATRPGRRRCLLIGRPATGGDAARPGCGPAHPQRGGPGRGGRARPPAGDRVRTVACSWRRCRRCGARWTSTRSESFLRRALEEGRRRSRRPDLCVG